MTEKGKSFQKQNKLHFNHKDEMYTLTEIIMVKKKKS